MSLIEDCLSCFGCLLVIGLFLWLLYPRNILSEGFEDEYQKDTEKEYNKRDIARDKFAAQDLDQCSIAKNQAQYAKTYVLPQQLADEYRNKYPSDLLPDESQANAWVAVNPRGSGSLEMKSMLESSQHLGVNTQGNSLRNANLQLRSEFPNPIIPITVFNNSSYTPDIYRKPLEIGSNCYSDAMYNDITNVPP